MQHGARRPPWPEGDELGMGNIMGPETWARCAPFLIELADIFLGKLRGWNDPALRALNLRIALPDAEITVVHRMNGSGTTFN